ncbi:MAG: OmpA/MotB family protein [Desulfobulbus sp.]|jgi:chemotaxis protein MotB
MAKEPECPPPGLPMWMATYSDLVTLLLTFFVLLLTMASMDPTKFIQAKTSIESAFGWRTTAAPVPFALPIIPSPPKAKFSPIPQATIAGYIRQIESDLKLARLEDQVKAVQKDNDSIILRINDSVLFESGKSTLNPAAYPLLRKIAEIIRPLPMTLRIEGHTDARPFASSATTNWDLSVARAVSVMSFFYRGNLLSQERMSAAGYGDAQPIAPNTTEEGRTQNRRVDFVLRSNRSVSDETGPVRPIPF